MRALRIGGQVAASALLACASYRKFADGYDGLRIVWTPWVYFGVATVEAALCVCLWSPPLCRLAAWFTLALSAAGVATLLVLPGRCGCLGALHLPAPVHAALLAALGIAAWAVLVTRTHDGTAAARA